MMNRGFGSGQKKGFRKRFGDRGNKFGEAKPVKIGEEHDVTITDVGAKGDGIAKINNFIIFVPGAKKGETMKIKIKEVSGRFAIGEKISKVEEETIQSSEEDSENIKDETEEDEEEIDEKE